MKGASQPEGGPKRIHWILSTYFAQGLPFMVVRILSSVFFTQLGVKERYLGYLNYLGLPWAVKFLWAPLVDGWGTKRGWQILMQAALAVCTALIAALAYLSASAPDGFYLAWIAALFVFMAFLAATNDIAIDAYYLEAVPSRGEQARLSGYRVLAYRMAMVFARSGIVALAAWLISSATLQSPHHAWGLAFAITAIVLASLVGRHCVALPRFEVEHSEIESQFLRAQRVFKQGFLTYLAQPKIGVIIAFIVLYKVGDELLFSMITPFMLRELKVSGEQYAWISGIVGAAGTIVGAMWGGWFIKRVGLVRAIWPLTLIMNLNIWLYVWLSWFRPDATTFYGVSVIATIHCIEQIAAGLGSSALLVFLLHTCSQQYKATHYAIGSAIMSIPGTLIGGQAGVIVEAIGYTNLYIIAFIASLPGMVLIPFVPMEEEG